MGSLQSLLSLNLSGVVLLISVNSSNFPLHLAKLHSLHSALLTYVMPLSGPGNKCLCI